MPVFAGFVLAGTAAGLWVPVFDSAAPLSLLGVLGLPLVWWLCGPESAAAALAFCLSGLHSCWYLDSKLHQGLVQADVLVQGVVADFPSDEGDSISFVLQLLPDAISGKFPQRVQLRIYSTGQRPKEGELWQFRVRLKHPQGTANIAGFNSDIWALWNHIHAVGYVRESALNRRLASEPQGTHVMRLRGLINRRIAAALGAHPMLALVQGITIAARQSIDALTWQILRDTGTSHLVSISGLHIGLAAAFLWYPGRLFGGVLHLLGGCKDPLLPARLLALSGALSYGALAGYPVPTLRSCLMISVILLLGWRRRHSLSGFGALCVVLLLLVLDDPFAILAAGAWLSFAAVALLYSCVSAAMDNRSGEVGSGTGWRVAVWRFIVTNWQAQVVLGLGLALPSLLFFAQVSLVSFIANPIAIPVFSFLILPLALLGALLETLLTGAGSWLLAGAATGLDWLIACMRLLAELPGAVWRPPQPDAGGFLLLLAAAGAALLQRPLPGRLAGVALLCILLARDGPRVDDLVRIQILDVGQGLAVLVQTSNHNLLYDTGARWRGGDSGQNVVVPVLQAIGVEELDTLIISHDDADHSGGLQSVLQYANARQILAPAAAYAGLSAAEECRAGSAWRWDGVEFWILHPVDRAAWSDNDASCVLLISAGGRQVLLPGDIETDAERQLLADADLHDVDLVLAPHHGSRTSSSQQFVTALGADFVVFSSGYANRWGMPKPDVVQRWVTSGACALTTATSGALEFTISGDGRFALKRAARATFARPWVLRNRRAGTCSDTVNGELGGL